MVKKTEILQNKLHNSKRKEDDAWEKIWDEIYEFQNTLSIESLPDDEDELVKMGLYITRGRNGEKLFINKELDRRLFIFRCSD